jgi:predicted RNA-binding protein with PUA-like domain
MLYCSITATKGKKLWDMQRSSKHFYQDPTTPDPNWVVVDLKPVQTLSKPVTLEFIKTDDFFKNNGFGKTKSVVGDAGDGQGI